MIRATHLLLILSICIACLASPALSQEQENSDRFIDSIWGFAGAEIGYSFVDTSTTGEANKHGFQVGPIATLSYSWSHITADLGGGWLFNESSGSSSSAGLSKDRVQTRAGFATTAVRYRFNPQWEAGVIGRLLFGADTSFKSTGTITDNANVFAGLQGVYRFNTQVPLQVSANLLTDLSISGRQVYLALVGLQVGFEIFSFRAKKEPAKTSPPVIIIAPVEKIVEPEPVEEVVPIIIFPNTKAKQPLYNYDLENIEFEVDSAKLPKNAVSTLKQLAKLLIDHKDDWYRMVLSGHADFRGSYEYNAKLSKQRANAVKQILVESGVPEKRIETKAHSFLRPLSEEPNEYAWGKNRRVEVKFWDVRNPEIFQQFFDKMK